MAPDYQTSPKGAERGLKGRTGHIEQDNQSQGQFRTIPIFTRW